jgi:hypothetical protein
MGLKYGVTQLENLKGFRARRWFDKEFVKCAERIADDYMTRNEIISGGTITEGSSATNSTFNVNLGDGTSATDIYAVLNGRIMAAIGYQTDRDLLEEDEAFMGNAIYSNGSAAAGATIDTDESAYATLIVCNSDGEGGALEDDNAQAQLLCIFAGTGTGDYDTDHLTSAEIRDALDATEGASADHSGTTGWAHYAQIIWMDSSGTVTVGDGEGGAAVMNRNNMISEA